MVRYIIVFAPAILRLVLMALNLVALQLTYQYFSNSVFLLYNTVIFLIGLHTALTYKAQVEIWEHGLPTVGSVLWAIVFAVGISITVGLILTWQLSIYIGVTLFILLKFFDRVVFNISLTMKFIFIAYLISISALALEILTFMTIQQVFEFDPIFVRFIFAAIFSMPLLLVIGKIFVSKIEPYSRTQPKTKYQGFYFSLHSFCILLVIMSDRLIASVYSDSIDYLNADYLLAFSYCSVIYTLSVALLEPKRPEFFEVSKACNNLGGFLRLTYGKYILGLSGAIIVISIASLILSKLDILPTIKLFGFNDILALAFGLLAFFCTFFCLSYIQIYFLARRWFSVLFLGWSIALVIRAVSYTSFDRDVFLLVSTFSGLLAISVLVLFGTKSDKS